MEICNEWNLNKIKTFSKAVDSVKLNLIKLSKEVDKSIDQVWNLPIECCEYKKFLIGDLKAYSKAFKRMQEQLRKIKSYLSD